MTTSTSKGVGVDAEDGTRRQIDPRVIDSPAEFAAQLTLLRKRCGLSIRAMSKLTGIPSATLGGYFSGRHLPSHTQQQSFRTVLQALGVTSVPEVRAWQDAVIRLSPNAPRGATRPSPFPGLQAFTQKDSEVFFGRSGEVAELVRRTEELRGANGRLLFVVGASGSGKSSVLAAGLAASLVAAGDSAVSIIVPGGDPVSALREALTGLTGSAHALLIVDQSEELFSVELDESVRQAFLDDLAQATSRPGGPVAVLGLRADFYGQAAGEALLLPALQSSQLVLGAMPLKGLREAIVEPCRQLGVSVDEELVELVIRDLEPASGRYNAGALPLVSHALLATWGNHKGSRLTVADYLAAGGLRGAVTQTAEDVLSSLDATGRAAAQWLFTRLVLVETETLMVRRRLSREALHHPDPQTDLAVDKVIGRFVAARLLTAGEGTVEISHEALLHAWPRLHEWVLDDLDAARLVSKISRAAVEWDEAGQDPDLLLRGAPLLEAHALAQTSETTSRTLTPQESRYVAASLERADDEQRSQHRRAQVLRFTVAVTTVLALLTTAAAVAAWRSGGEADRQRQAAERQRVVAERTASLAVAAIQTRDRDPAVSQQVATKLNDLAPSAVARSILLSSTSGSVPARLVVDSGIQAAAVSASGALVVAGAADGLTRLWALSPESESYERLPDLPVDVASLGTLRQAAFVGDSRMLITAESDDESSRIVVWDMADPTAPVESSSRTFTGKAQTLAVAQNGSRLALGTESGTVLTWRLRDGALSGAARARVGVSVTALAFSTNARLLVGTEDGSLMTLDRAGLRSAWVSGSPARITGLAAGRDGQEVFLAQSSGGVRQLRMSKAGRLRDAGRVGDPGMQVNGLALSGDGRQVAVAAAGDGVTVFEVPTGRVVTDLGTPTPALAVQFAADGARLMSTESGGVIRLWPLPVPVLGGFSDTVWSIAATTKGDLMAVATGPTDGVVQVFEGQARGQLVARQSLRPPHGGGDGEVSMSGDGAWLAAGTSDGRIGVWRLDRKDRYRLVDVVRGGQGLIESLAISANGRFVAAVNSDGILAVWALTQGGPLALLGADSIGAEGLAIAVNPRGTIVAVGTTDGTVQLWSLSEGSATFHTEVGGLSEAVFGVAFDPSGRYLAAGGADRTVRLWDLGDLKAQPAVLTGPGGELHAVAWNSDGSQLAAASSDGAVWLWDHTRRGQPSELATLVSDSPGQLFAAAFLGADVVAAGGTKQVVTTWQTDAAAVAASTCQRTGQGLTEQEWQKLVPSVAFLGVCE